ncbi:hypothetical protein [Rhodococcoides fascians]|uniref:hypothetical protein n=1 Tax=Rhodococcoides fascians TaxID=1828 RepID=UPI001FC902E9|nr:hypothetical protein [Rhodococcus fascians]
MTIVSRTRTAALSVVIGALLLAGCTAEDRSDADRSLENAAGSASSIATSVRDRAGSVFDEAKVQAFVVAFRAQFGGLAEGRDDTAIENLLSSTCNEIAGGTPESDIVAQLEVEAAKGDAVPTTEQAQRIYDQAALACP